MQIKKIFQFDTNKCVACHACVVACAIENKTELPINWREVNTFNQFHYPELAVFHYSLACNHCDDAPCMYHCPALAYTKDLLSGAVVHNENHCIGCKYCTWACPYDAPKFNKAKGIVEKCTFCTSRTSEGLKPACANLCPTGALDYIEKSDNQIITESVGFNNFDIAPSIHIISLRNENAKPEIIPEINTSNRTIKKKQKESKITFKKEWPLVIFTLSMAYLVAEFFALVFYDYQVNSYVFTSLNILAGFFSSFHLGKKIRAYRAFFNVKNSWLSREILSFSLFFIATTVHFFIFKDDIITYIALFSAVFLLISIDKVYRFIIQPTPLELHSAHVTLTGFLIAALFFNNLLMFALVVSLKTGLYIYRKYYFWKNKQNYRPFLTAWRLDMLISFPFIFWLFNFSNLNWWILASILIGEFIDRAEYYEELDVLTPEKQIETDFNRLHNN